MFSSQRQFNSLCKKFYLTILQLIIFGLFFLIASCSTQGPSRKGVWHPEKTQKYGKNKNYKFDYRKNRLLKKEKESPNEVQINIGSIADFKRFKDDMDPASLTRVINNQLGVMYEQDPASPVRLGDYSLTRGRLIKTLEEFQGLLQKNLPQEAFVPFQFENGMGQSG